ncbi:DUF2971 domain-containing protein [Pseudomonas maioricensis]|uniref:DUF2971 domain-containing protein n=1 Tax=Pseudomonas maioricensis TaxID=1766623 RepID=UPI001FAE1A19
MPLYKYCRVDKYSLNNLSANNIFLNHHSAFNDPFECRCEIIYGFPLLSDPSDRLIAVLNAWGFSDPEDDLVKEHYPEFAESLEEGEPIIELFIERARISCFSERNNNLLMWAHYGDGLRGFCVEFDPDLIIPAGRDARVYKVLYEDSPAVIDASVMAMLYDQRDWNNDAYFETQTLSNFYGDDRSADLEMYTVGFKCASERLREIYQKMLATKPIAWSYEEELRLIDFDSRDNDLGVLLEYSAMSVKSVIIGERMSAEKQIQLIAIIKSVRPGLRIQRAIMVKGSFDIEVVDFE